MHFMVIRINYLFPHGVLLLPGGHRGCRQHQRLYEHVTYEPHLLAGQHLEAPGERTTVELGSFPTLTKVDKKYSPLSFSGPWFVDRAVALGLPRGVSPLPAAAE